MSRTIDVGTAAPSDMGVSRLLLWSRSAPGCSQAVWMRHVQWFQRVLSCTYISLVVCATAVYTCMQGCRHCGCCCCCLIPRETKARRPTYLTLTGLQDMRQTYQYNCARGGGCTPSGSSQAFDPSPTGGQAPQRSSDITRLPASLRVSDIRVPANPKLQVALSLVATQEACVCLSHTSLRQELPLWSFKSWSPGHSIIRQTMLHVPIEPAHGKKIDLTTVTHYSSALSF